MLTLLLLVLLGIGKVLYVQTWTSTAFKTQLGADGKFSCVLRTNVLVSVVSILSLHMNLETIYFTP
jgi:hypothetical protein